jgi:F-type H+-transporting ATPase subunit beta
MAQIRAKIVQCIGAVVDVEFARDQMQKFMTLSRWRTSAAKYGNSSWNLLAWFRTIALGDPTVLRRGNMVATPARQSWCRVGRSTLGRIMAC